MSTSTVVQWDTRTSHERHARQLITRQCVANMATGEHIMQHSTQLAGKPRHWLERAAVGIYTTTDILSIDYCIHYYW